MGELADGMTLEQQIGQVFMVGFHGVTPSSDLLDLIQQHQVGGVILFSRNVRDAAQTQALTNSLQASARASGHRSPLLIATDQENGLVQRFGAAITPFPGAMALGATGSAQLAREVAEATGQELRALGVNMNLAPVADVNNNPANPVIGVRSFGEDPELVARLVAATVEGYHAAGIIATLKHFPGHGDTTTDSHLALPIVPHTLERLQQIELPPFRCGIAAGADAIMTAHLALPQFAMGADTNAAPPATLAAEVIQGLLREQLGFTGVVISDCLEMQAIAEGVGVAAGAVLALRAGIDLVLVSHRADRQRAALAAVRAAVAHGELAATTLRQAAERTLHLKARYLSWDTLPSPVTLSMIGGSAHRRLRDTAYARSMTLVRDEAGLIPARVAPTAHILVVSPQGGSVSQAVDLAYSVEDLVASIRRYHANVSSVSLALNASAGDLQQLCAALEAAELILLPTLNLSHDPLCLTSLRSLLSTAPDGRRMIGIAIGAPYDAAALPMIPTYLATYEYTPPALDAAVDVLFGAARPQGRVPVTLSRGAATEGVRRSAPPGARLAPGTCDTHHRT